MATFRQRVVWWLLLSGLVCAIVNPGNFGTIDTTRRLQVARWIRRGEPAVLPSDTSFGLIGRGGVRHAWYGIGQSLVLIPFDALVSATMAPQLGRYVLSAEKQQQVEFLVIAFLMQWVITTCVLALAYALLRRLEFTPAQSLAGVLALLFGTTFLYYVQSAQENNLLLLLALLALYSVLRWQTSGHTQWAVTAGAACGFAILVRLTSMLETTTVLAIALSLSPGAKRFVMGFVPPVFCGLAVDRWYQWHRFGELFSTYMGIFGRQARPSGASASFPFSYPFWKGFLGTLFSKDKSVFLFDPLLIVLGIALVWGWQTMRRDTRAVILWLSVLLILYASVYATYFDFGGDSAWGHRFVTLPVHLLCLFAVPLILNFRREMPATARRIAWIIVGGATFLQAASTTIPVNLEILQRDLGSSHSVIVNRGISLFQFARGRDVLGSHSIPLEWRSLSYFPFQLRFRFSELAPWAIAIWMIMLAGLIGLVTHLVIRARLLADKMPRVLIILLANILH